MQKPEYVVAYKRALTCKKGVVGPGEAIDADCFHNGQEGFDLRLASGHIVTYGDYHKQLHLMGLKDGNAPKATTTIAKPAPNVSPAVAVEPPAVEPPAVEPDEVIPTFKSASKRKKD